LKSAAIAKAAKLKKVPEREPFFVWGKAEKATPRCNFRSFGGEREPIPKTG